MNDEYYAQHLKAYPTMHLPCGGTANFDWSSGISYRCGDCGSVVASIGQPQRCKDADQFWKGWEQLGGQGWDYHKGQPKK